MSHTSVKDKIKTLLWVSAAGRCQFDGCNKPLWRDNLTLRKMNAAYVAHIVADKPRGPRGDKLRSRKLASDIGNLMLLCDVHHRLIDVEDVAGHPELVLLRMKQQHEQRVELLTSIDPEKQSTVVTYAAPVGETCPQIDHREAHLAMVPDRFPTEPHAIQLGAKNTSLKDQEKGYWTAEVEQLRRQFAIKVHERLQDGSVKHVSLFAIAPQPLLIVLGSLFTDIVPTDVFQRHREPASWKWREVDAPLALEVRDVPTKAGDVALNLSLSAKIDNERISKVIGTGIPIWTVTIPTPGNDCLKSRECLRAFRGVIRSHLAQLRWP
jgi:hypothetical protein